MYVSCQYRILHNGTLSQPLPSKTGVKQGCNLSPLLSNLFQNDLHEQFNAQCEPVMLHDTPLNSLSWADDLILVSKSAKGLQCCLDILQEYCTKWRLRVNESKTKIMAVGKSGSELIFFNNTLLDYVKEFKYLGIIISNNGKWNKAVNDRCEKSNRAVWLIRKAISVTSNINVKLALTLFDKMIAPIVLYGCDIWGAQEINKCIYVSKIKESDNCRNVVKNILGEIAFSSCKRVGKKSPGQHS